MFSQGRDDAATTSWALAARGGDRDAAAAFIRSTQHDLYRFLIHLTGPAEAEDLTQETYLRALRSLPTFDGRSSARTWLFAIARRVAADQVRTAMRRPRTVGLDAVALGAQWSSPGGDFEETVLLRRLLLTLEPQRREAFVATQILGLSYADAAVVCGCPVGTIRSRVARARDDLITAMRADETRADEQGERRTAT